MTAIEYNKQIPEPGVYARSWRTLNTLPADYSVSVPGWVVGMPGWGNMTRKAGDVIEILRGALDRRINARAGYEPREPRDGEMFLHRDARRVRDHFQRRIRLHSLETRTATNRFKHIITDYGFEGAEL